MSATDEAGAVAVARGCYWKSGGREFFRLMSLSGESWDVADGAAADLMPGLAHSGSLCVCRVEGGRWGRAASAYPDTRGGRLLVELTAAEVLGVAGGGMPRAVFARISRAIDAGVPAPESFTAEIPARCCVSNRGRHGGKLGGVGSAPIIDAEADPIMRANGVLYYPRKLAGRWDVDVIRALHAVGRSALLKGAPGTGKTALLEAAFTLPGGVAAYEYVPGTADTEAADFVGTFVPEPGGGYRWVDGPLLRALEAGIPLIVDEIALIDPRALSIVYAAMDGRRECYVTANPLRGTVKAQEGFGLHAACNPDAPGADMSEALLSRMFLQVEYMTDYSLAGSKFGVPARVLTAARNLEKKRQEGEVTWSPQMRDLIGFAEAARLFGEAAALSNLVGSAPAVDVPVVADVFSRMVGSPVVPLCIGEVEV